MSLDQAEGIADLDLFEDAWEAVENLPPNERTDRRALRVRLRCAVWFEKYDLAEVLANVLRHGDETERLMAACAFQSIAAYRCHQGRISEARAMIEAAIETRPEQRIAILEDRRFPDDFI